MRTMGVRKLRDHFSEVLQAVEEAGEIIEVTNHGRVVARLVPAQAPPLVQREIAEIIAYLDSLTTQLGARWPTGVTVQDALDDVRG